MANRVLTIFEADAKQYFATADAVAARNKSFESPAAQAQTPIITQQKAATEAVVAESGKQIAAERATTKAVVEESQKRIAAKKAEAEQIAAIPITSTRPLVPANPQRFEQGKSPAQILFESGAPGARVNAGANSLARLSTFERDANLQELRDSTANLKARETGFANYFKNLTALRAADLIETKAVNAAETVSTVKAAEEQAVARRSSLVGRENLAIPLGGGLTSRIGISGSAGLAIAAGVGALAVGAEFATSAALAYSKNVAEAEARTARLRAVSNELSIAQKDLASSIEEVSTKLHITREEAEQVVVPLADIANKTRKPIKDLQADIIDLSTARGIEKDALPGVLKNIAAGTADAAAFGRNAASVFDLYAASIGTTADKLDDLQKQQALANELIRQGEINSGANANSLANQTIQVDGLSKAWTKFKDTVGEGATPVLKGLLNSLTTALGGTPDNGRFDFTRGGAAVVKNFSDDIEAEAKETKTRMDAFVKSFNDDKKLLQDAIANPNANITNKALSTIDLTQFLQQTPEQRQQIKQDAIANAKTVVDSQVQAIATGFSINGGNVSELGRLKGVLDLYKNLIDPEKFKTLSDQGTRAIDGGFKNMIEVAKNNLPRLRQIFQQIVSFEGLDIPEKNDLLKTINEQIKQSVDAGKAKVKELASAFQSAFETVTAREGAQNPFLQLLDEADKRTRTLREQMKGLSKDVQEALLARNARQDALDLFGLRIDTRLNASNLLDQARQFRAGKLDDTNDPLTIQKQLQEKLDAIQPITGFINKVVGQVSGGSLPAGNIFATVPTFAAVDKDQQALINQRIIAATQGLNPAQLTPDQNRIAAQAREAEAKRQLGAEKDAQTARQAQVDLQTSIDKNIKALLDVVNKGGLEALVKIINEAPDSASVTKTKKATPAATAERFDGVN